MVNFFLYFFNVFIKKILWLIWEGMEDRGVGDMNGFGGVGDLLVCFWIYMYYNYLFGIYYSV